MFAFFELLLVVAIIIFFVTQVFIPISRHTMLFPAFRTREPQLKKTITELNQKAIEKDLENEIKIKSKQFKK